MDIALNLPTANVSSHTTQAHQDEQVLVQGCLREERWAQKKLYETYYPKMMGVCMRYAANREEARDVLNEGYIKVFNHLEKYNIGTSLEAWIKRIMVNTAIDYYRRTSRHRNEDIDTAYNYNAEDEDAISHCSAEEIMSVIQKLSPSYRAVFNLFAIEGYNHKEISEMLDINESTSRSNLVKARVKLQRMLAHLE